MARRTLAESGEWRDGKAAPQLVRQDLRRLPADLVTKDVDDPDKAHEIDAPHVVSAIIKDFIKANAPSDKPETADGAAKKLWAPGPGERAPVRQWFVDVVKLRVISSMVNRAVEEFAAGIVPDLAPCHLWFPVDNANEYLLRRGNPPPRKDRPRHLRDIDLVVDVMNPPRSIVDELRRRGVELDPALMLERAIAAERAGHERLVIEV